MSHFVVMVIGDCPEEQLEPFDENLKVEEYVSGEVSDEEKQQMLDYYNTKHKRKYKSFESCYVRNGSSWNGNRWRKDEDGIWREYSTYNPDSKWDWYQLGGRWSGDFIILKDAATSGMKGSSGVFGNEVGIDAAIKGDIDFSAIRQRGRDMGQKVYQEIAVKCGGAIPKPEILWSDLIHSERYAHLSIEQKRELYHSQDAIKIWSKAVGDSLFGYHIEDFQCPEEEYARRCELNSFVPYAILHEGEWIGRGDMGWFGVSMNECDADEWNAKVWKIVESLSDDTLISFYDCHI